MPGADTQQVLRNTCMLLALTMITTIIGAYIGTASGAVLVLHPMTSTLIMLGAVIGKGFRGGGIRLKFGSKRSS